MDYAMNAGIHMEETKNDVNQHNVIVLSTYRIIPMLNKMMKKFLKEQSPNNTRFVPSTVSGVCAKGSVPR